MKKLYFLLVALFFVTTINVNAQDDIIFGFDTDGDSETWEGAGADVTVAGGILNLAFTGTYAKLINTVAGVDADTYRYIQIKMKNNSSDELLRVSIPKVGGRVYFNLEISANDTEFKTYTFDLTNDNWVGIVNDIQIHIKKDASTISDGIGSIDFDEIRFMVSIPKDEKLVFDFDTDDDSEGWSPINGSMTVSGGLLTFVPTADKYAKMEQVLYTVDADVNQYFTIVLKNESVSDDLFRIIYTGGTYDIPITTEDANFKTYSVRVADSTGWEGIQENVTMRLSYTENGGQSTGTGNLIIESMEFSTGIILATEDLYLDENPSITLYPNPVRDVLNIKVSANIQKIEVYDIVGKKALVQHGLSTTLNTSSLEKGVYILKVYQDNGASSTKRFFKE